MTSWRPRERACAEIGSPRDPSKPLSISAYKAARRVLEDRGFLGLVAQGWTSALRAAVLDDQTGTSAVFVLTVPRRKQRLRSDKEPPRVNRPLTGSRREPDIAPRAREARTEVKDGNPEVKGEKARAPHGQPVLPPAGAAPLAAIPENRTEALAAAQAMQERARLLRRVSAEHLRHLARPFFAAGWSPRDLLHAIDHEPGGRQHAYTSGVRSPAGWNPLTAGRVVRPGRCPAAVPQPAPHRDPPPGPRRPGRPPGPRCRRPGSGRGLPGAGRPGTGDAPRPAHRCPRFSPLDGRPVPVTLTTHPAVPAFRKLDAVAVLTARLLPGHLETVHARMASLPKESCQLGRTSSRVGELQAAREHPYLLWQCHSATVPQQAKTALPCARRQPGRVERSRSRTRDTKVWGLRACVGRAKRY